MRLPEMRAKHGAILNSPAAREKMRAIMQTPEYREKMRRNMLGRKFPQKMTDIELLLMKEFQKRRLHFVMNKPMFNGWICDFVFEPQHLIVEADGEYWHNRPERQESDQRLVAIAEANGWNVFHFSGTEIKENAAGCAKTVARFIHSSVSQP
jgi:very-short-patch-repair endonuclease